MENLRTDGRDEESPFLSSPKGTPRSMTMQNFTGIPGQAIDHVREALVHNRNELVLLFSRFVRFPKRKTTLGNLEIITVSILV
jgi:hypothetical protein